MKFASFLFSLKLDSESKSDWERVDMDESLKDGVRVLVAKKTKEIGNLT